ncbi:hypothetical protein [Streptomyces sp. NPDC018610]|uniref:hypothetical protein n=1 Tax=Streptomyces sp. NPDC018610 TaxID=3365049 RepID=UPI0037B54EA1
MVFKRCPNCGGPMQPFRSLTDAEKAHVRGARTGFPPEAYIRCARPGCRRYQRRLKWDDGGDLPEN